MKIMSLFPVKTDKGGLFLLDIEITPKMMRDFEPFELDDYSKVIEFIDENYPDISYKERMAMIDKLLFSKDEEEQ